MQITRHHFVAHRGYQKHYPENTLLAVRKAIDAGALYIELDVQLSRDQVPVLYHDDTLARMSGRAGKVCEFTAQELSLCPAHEPQRFGAQFAQEKIATLAELVPVIQANPAVTFYIELKEEAVRDHGAEICLRQTAAVLRPVKTQCVLISFDLDALAAAAAAGFDRIGPVLRDWASRNRQIAALQASVMFINKNRIPAQEPVSAQCPIVVYEVDDRMEAQQWLQRGAARVETFAVGEMIRDCGSMS